MGKRDEEDQAMIRAMFGKHARKAAFNYVIQDAKEPGSPLVGVTQFGQEMAFGATGTHTLVLCDVVIRPHLVITSEHLVGEGLMGILRCGMADPGEWLKHGKVIIDNMPQLKPG